jgi:hypothetical protein
MLVTRTNFVAVSQAITMQFATTHTIYCYGQAKRPKKIPMIKSESNIGVAYVQRSSEWYQKLLNCDGTQVGDTYEILANAHSAVFLCLHKGMNTNTLLMQNLFLKMRTV